jgi:hypothetical protein
MIQNGFKEVFVVSFVENGKNQLGWVASPIKRSAPRIPGCAQCGRRLEINGSGKFALSGRCDECQSGFYEGDEFIDHFEL